MIQLLLTLICLPALPVLLSLLRGFDWFNGLLKNERSLIFFIYLMIVYAVILWHLFEPVY